MKDHTHYFSETLVSDATGTDRRCQCGARLWEPAARPVLTFSGGAVFNRNGRLVFERRPNPPPTGLDGHAAGERET